MIELVNKNVRLFCKTPLNISFSTSPLVSLSLFSLTHTFLSVFPLTPSLFQVPGSDMFQYTFDGCYDANATQQTIFDQVTRLTCYSFTLTLALNDHLRTFASPSTSFHLSNSLSPFLPLFFSTPLLFSLSLLLSQEIAHVIPSILKGVLKHIAARDLEEGGGEREDRKKCV